MIVDTSAIVAILRKEPEAIRCADLLVRAEAARLSAATYLEAAIVIDGSGNHTTSRQLDALVEAAGITIEPVTEHQARLARTAYREFGRGSGNPARLNFGDCFAYALAKETDEPLLFVGNDFVHTDVDTAGDSSGFHRGSPQDS